MFGSGALRPLGRIELRKPPARSTQAITYPAAEPLSAGKVLPGSLDDQGEARWDHTTLG